MAVRPSRMTGRIAWIKGSAPAPGEGQPPRRLHTSPPTWIKEEGVWSTRGCLTTPAVSV